MGSHFLGVKSHFPTWESIFWVQKMSSRPGKAFPSTGTPVPSREDSLQTPECQKNVNTENVCNIFLAFAVIESRTHRKKTWKGHELESN